MASTKEFIPCDSSSPCRPISSAGASCCQKNATEEDTIRRVRSAAEEWRDSWGTVLVSMLGIAGATLFPYTSSLLMVPLTRLFGWTHSQYSLAFVLQMALGLAVAPLVGRLIAKYGPRLVLLIGIPFAVVGFACLGMVGAPIWQWWVLAIVQGFTIAFVFPVGWITAVSSLFETSRGMAIAVALAGVGLGGATWPILGQALVQWLGWRAAFLALALTWGILVFPLAYLFLPSRTIWLASSTESRRGNKGPVKHALGSRLFVMLATAGSLFLLTVWALNLHLVAMLEQRGYTPMSAARVSGLAGIAAIVGRILTGFLLDRLPVRWIAVVAFSVPIFAVVLLSGSAGVAWQPVLGVLVLGLSLGSETDIVAYVASREFPPDVFASVYAIISAIFAVCAATGPLIASFLFDKTGSYLLFYIVASILFALAATLIAITPMRTQQSRTEKLDSARFD
jgi:MFS family permease